MRGQLPKPLGRDMSNLGSTPQNAIPGDRSDASIIPHVSVAAAITPMHMVTATGDMPANRVAADLKTSVQSHTGTLTIVMPISGLTQTDTIMAGKSLISLTLISAGGRK